MADSRQPAAINGVFWTVAAFALLSLACGEGWRTARREAGRLNEHNRELSVRLTALESEVAAPRQAADEYKARAEKAIGDLEKRIASFTTINHGRRAELGEPAGPFAVPQGEIRWIDSIGRKVWINLGEADGVKPRITFSVGSKNRTRIHKGKVEMSVGPDDRKAAIEVTRVLEDDLAEARILHEALHDPIAKGDLLYSPIWRKAQGESFSIVGTADLNGDGHDDRDRLTKMVAVAAGRIDNDVDAWGILRVNGKIAIEGKPQVTASTKFIVIGQVPEVKDGDDPQTVDRIQKILSYRKEIEDAARERGIRVISLNDFVKYLGYSPNPKSTSGSAHSGDKSTKAKTFSGGSGWPSPYRK
jgi:hypothetical protein